MKKIIVTGASGFLGSRIVQYYKGKYNIYTPTHKELDITNEDNVNEVFAMYHPNVVIHCAAVSNTTVCEKEPEKSWRINVDGSVNIAKASERIGAKSIFCSSDQVYFDTPIVGSHKENEVLQPPTVYGREKLIAEQKCLEVNPACVLLRLSWMYDTNTLNANEHGDFIRTLLLKLKTEEILTFPIYDWRGITDVNEVVQNLEKTFELIGGVYNFGSPNTENVYDTMMHVFSSLNMDIGKLHRNVDAFASKPRNITMNQEKINSCGIEFSLTAEGIIRNLGVFYG